MAGILEQLVLHLVLPVIIGLSPRFSELMTPIRRIIYFDSLLQLYSKFQAGIFSGLPHMLRMIWAYIYSKFSDYLLTSEKMNRTNVRKLATFVCKYPHKTRLHFQVTFGFICRCCGSRLLHVGAVLRRMQRYHGDCFFDCGYSNPWRCILGTFGQCCGPVSELRR